MIIIFLISSNMLLLNMITQGFIQMHIVPPTGSPPTAV